MRAGGAKAKGNSFEIEIAKLLSKWLTNSERSDVLERSPGSGAKYTALQKRKLDFNAIAGDLIAVDGPGFPLINSFVIEIKHRNETGINADSLIYRTSETGLIGFWQKLLQECVQTNKLPMLIFKQNNRPIIVGLPDKGVELFDLYESVECRFRFKRHLSMNTLRLLQFIEVADPSLLK
jgi:hypothetical protein